MKTHYSIVSICIALISTVLLSCQENRTSLSTSQSQEVKDSVLKLADLTAKDITAKGPIAWLDHFEDSPDFFMVNEGTLALSNYRAADSFIKTTLVKVMPKITLKWSAIRVDPLTSQIAIMAANFHEDAADASGKITPYDGYFTATIHKTEKGWKFRNEHWSLKPKNN
ncbi:MAG TPA: hypothetical protein VK671_16225 [Mucilaginibacter sp.]|jgi:hypothetical protein|nr:hypothetical protein [Mucilaginibacter sp.]